MLSPEFENKVYGGEEDSIMDYYRNFGYKCVVIWDFENSLVFVKEKLGSVMKSELPSGKYIGIRSATEGGGLPSDVKVS